MLPISQRLCQSGKRSFTLSATDRSPGYSPLRVTDGPAQFGEFRNYFTLLRALSTQGVGFSLNRRQALSLEIRNFSKIQVEIILFCLFLFTPIAMARARQINGGIRDRSQLHRCFQSQLLRQLGSQPVLTSQ